VKQKKDKSYRFRLPSELFEAATAKAASEDLTLAQVLRRFLREWIKEGAPEEPEKEED
jgi:predicted DNA binding CopG/RHH family protein